jgi:uncharacterized protein YggU (UPF0235/DUF167 family)
VRALIEVGVKPGAKAPGIIVSADGPIVVRVRERATEGKANDAVRRAIARALGLPPSAVTLVRGAAARRKHFAIEGLTPAEARAKLGVRPPDRG